MHFKKIDVDKNLRKQEFIQSGNINEVIDFAKTFNIFQDSTNKMYQHWCTLIKQRLDKEGLSHETVRPE